MNTLKAFFNLPYTFWALLALPAIAMINGNKAAAALSGTAAFFAAIDQ